MLQVALVRQALEGRPPEGRGMGSVGMLALSKAGEVNHREKEPLSKLLRAVIERAVGVIEPLGETTGTASDGRVLGNTAASDGARQDGGTRR